MGLLAVGTPLEWEEGQKHAEHIRQHGITQLLNIWDQHKDREGDPFLWGDEIELMLITFSDEEKAAKLSLCQPGVLSKLGAVVKDLSEKDPEKAGLLPEFQPEYGSYMLESTPGSPYSGSLLDLLSVEANMRERRSLASANLNPNQAPISIASFPRLGAKGIFTEPHYDPASAVSSHSLFLPEEIINPLPRLTTITANVRKRRGAKVAVNVPIFHDKNTPRPFIDPTIPHDRNVFPEDQAAKNGAALPDHIYLDSVGFGAGCCCLQLTMQASNVTEARTLYDALVPLAPILMALTAAAPAYRGYLSEVDCRWDVLAGSIDDRTPAERGIEPHGSEKRIPKSRYGSVDCYLSTDPSNLPEYNDVPLVYDEGVFKRLEGHGIDKTLAQHFAHLFIRDPLAMFSGTLDQDDSKSSDHFENIQATNWQSLRFKPPPLDSSIGWRVEFRSMEVQMTDFENAAFSIFLVLLSRAILNFRLNFYVPISKVDENMERAQRRDAVTQRKFWFRKQVDTTYNPPKPPSSNLVDPPQASPNESISCPNEHSKHRTHHELGGIPEEYEEMTMNEIINGNTSSFSGLLGMVDSYLKSLKATSEQKRKIRIYLELVKRRANGSLMTPASWIRKFVRSHPAYRFDSVVSQEINYDLLKAIKEFERGGDNAEQTYPRTYLQT